jgi:transposase InsO family protein
MIDRSTRWVEAVPLLSTSSDACVEALISTWVARFGVPTLLTSDRGVQFTSSVWTTLCTRLGITPITTTAYHPQSNGMVERWHRQLKDTLLARLAGVAWRGWSISLGPSWACVLRLRRIQASLQQN